MIGLCEMLALVANVLVTMDGLFSSSRLIPRAVAVDHSEI